MTGGLSEVSVVPRNRIELLTRGFSVQPSLLMDMLSHLAALGRAAEELGRALGCNDHHWDHEEKPVPQLTADIASRPRRDSNTTSQRSMCSAPIGRPRIRRKPA
jgi:hypothetical protein